MCTDVCGRVCPGMDVWTYIRMYVFVPTRDTRVCVRADVRTYVCVCTYT